MRPQTFVLAPVLALLMACGDGGGGPSRANPTYIEVDPDEFLGDIPCSDSPGGLRWYVATLVDLTALEQGQELALPSSPPTSCTRSVFFSGVVALGSTLGVMHEAHEYVAEIEAYDEARLEPRHTGSPVMQSMGRTVEPDWIGSCGTHASRLAPLLGIDAGVGPQRDAGFATHFRGPLTPSAQRTVTFRSCSLRAVSTRTLTTSVRVDPATAAGSVECGDEPGQIARFEIRLGDVVRSTECGTPALFDVEAGVFLVFAVTAFEAASGGDAGSTAGSWTTRCYQEPVAGLELAARCDPLVASE